ncbi:uncharacterized protein LOC129948173 [Eupeodes corollae]|uniref:uncharacterized protein LOC129948173 n=1 Tax=Eupeodes corollae TaxID=290404 RepID=UPI0024921D6D|nr:uncharacterized protein LOC129948173 [Eupeodes corollae]
MEDRRTHKYKHIQEEAKANHQTCLRRSNPRLKLSKKVKNLIVKPSIWDDIVSEDRELENYIRKKKLQNEPKFECASNYIQRQLFPQLIPAFELICSLTLEKGAQDKPVRFFNFIDGLAEYLYNTNQLFKERKENWKSIHQVYENKERTFYPYFWFLTPDEAATMIQALVRGFLVRCKMNSTMESMGTSSTSVK